MDRRRPATGWRAASFAAALFAITLNFLQPLAHAALMRDGGPMALSLWTSMCAPSAGQDDTQDSMPAAGKMHECCLGLAHAPTLAVPFASFVAAPLFAVLVDRLPVAVDALAAVGIRDGPNQPRAPTLLRLTCEAARVHAGLACVLRRVSRRKHPCCRFSRRPPSPLPG